MTSLSGTVVTYPDGDTSSTSTVVHVADLGDGRSAIVLDTTAFHPVDTAWPDQPADRGVLVRSDGTEIPVIDGVIGAFHADEMVFGRDVPVRTGTEGWTFVVAHVIDRSGLADGSGLSDGSAPAVGEEVTVGVDEEHRAALSRGHTACHLASLALDAALADAWRKDVATDALGAPAFDALAIEESRILPDGSRDQYRIGKSLRRKGFDPAALDDLDALAERVDAMLSGWCADGGRVRIEREGRGLADRRAWVCALPGAEVRIPCGGTHVDDLSALASITTRFETAPVDGGVQLVMTTTVVPATAASSS